MYPVAAAREQNWADEASCFSKQIDRLSFGVQARRCQARVRGCALSRGVSRRGGQWVLLAGVAWRGVGVGRPLGLRWVCGGCSTHTVTHRSVPLLIFLFQIFAAAVGGAAGLRSESGRLGAGQGGAGRGGRAAHCTTPPRQDRLARPGHPEHYHHCHHT